MRIPSRTLLQALLLEFHPHLLNQICWEWDSGICLFCNQPSDAYAYSLGVDTHSFKPVGLRRGQLCTSLGGVSGNVWRHFGWSQLAFLASNDWRAVIALSILQCIGQHHTTWSSTALIVVLKRRKLNSIQRDFCWVFCAYRAVLSHYLPCYLHIWLVSRRQNF